MLLARVRYLAGVPSAVALAAITTFYLVVNAVTYWAAVLAGSRPAPVAQRRHAA